MSRKDNHKFLVYNHKDREYARSFYFWVANRNPSAQMSWDWDSSMLL